MKKLLGILVLGLSLVLLNSCEESDKSKLHKHEKGWSCLEPAGELTAHELGHMLGLHHKGTEGKDLMKWGAGQIITKKIATASRKYYKKYLKKKLN